MNKVNYVERSASLLYSEDDYPLDKENLLPKN